MFISADLIPELVKLLESKNAFTDLGDISKFWNYGPGKYPACGLDRATYRMFTVLTKVYPFLTQDTLRSVITNKFVYRGKVLEMLNMFVPSHQERLVHLLEQHIEPDD